jgi:hypothetical protein
MNIKRTVARELVYALLAGSAEPAGALIRCSRVLGENPAWLRLVVDTVSARFVRAWHSGSINAMTRAILDHPGFHSAWLVARRPRLFSPALDGLPMAPRPWTLEACAVPELNAIGDLAAWLDEPEERLPWLAQAGFRVRPGEAEALSHYVYRWLGKRSGGYRLLEAPKPRLRAIQRRILHGLLECVPPHEAAQGFRRGHSCLSNAALHLGQEVVVRLDLRDFFLHVGRARVDGLFRSLGYSAAVSRLLAGLCSNRVPAGVVELPPDRGARPDWETGKRYRAAHLPQGAPTSPALANLCAFRLDLRLQGLAEHWGGTYSRYADDMIISGGRQMARATDRFIPLVGAIAAEEGFALNHRKTRIMTRSGRQVVTGIVVNRWPNVPREDYDTLKAILYNCVRHGPHGQNTAGHGDFRAHLLGRVAQVRHVHPERGRRLLELFRRIEWE